MIRSIFLFKEYVEEKGYRVFPICAPINIGVPELMGAAAEELRKAPENPQEEDDYEYFDFENDDKDPDFKEVYAEKRGKCLCSQRKTTAENFRFHKL